MHTRTYLLFCCFVFGQHIQSTEGTFGAACADDSGCSTPSEFCSASSCACSSGYSHDGNGVCVVVDCGTPTDPTNGAISVTGTSYTNTATVTCNTGYSLIGSSPITCSSSGTWTTIPTCSSGSVIDVSFRNVLILSVVHIICRYCFVWVH